MQCITNFMDLAWGNGLLVGVLSNGKVATSTDVACLGATCVFIGSSGLIASVTGAGY
jgi:hypothetical protein